MRLCVLISSYEHSDSPFRLLDTYPNPVVYGPGHEWTTYLVEKAKAVRTVRQLCKQEFDVFVNLCDGAPEEDRAGAEVMAELERQGQAYTGAGPQFFNATRKAMKLMCPDVGVPSPRYVFASNPAEIDLAASRLSFPLLVKHPDGYGSLGLTRASRVMDADHLKIRAQIIIKEYGSALIEEFVEGREFTVLVADPLPGNDKPHCYPPIEIIFPPGETFHHFDLKWNDNHDLSVKKVCDTTLVTMLQKMAALIFEGLHGSGYARCDFRLGNQGMLYLVDVNPNPGIFFPPGFTSSADYILSVSPGGHGEFLEHILASALARHELRSPKWVVQHDPDMGYGIVAARDIAAGERIMLLEETPHQLVSAAHVQKYWPSWRVKVFEQCAFPVSDELFVIWNDNPERWFPTNHSCDPSAVLDGLNYMARRAMHPGEPITLDYATFAGPNMAPFRCYCGSPLCRRMIRGSDYLAPWLEERYGDHIHSWVKAARRQAGLPGRQRRSSLDSVLQRFLTIWRSLHAWVTG